MSDEKALQIALGNLNINNGEVIFDYDPDVHIPKVRLLLARTTLIKIIIKCIYISPAPYFKLSIVN